MNILWIPHNPWGSGRFQRDQYLLQELSSRHRFFVLNWSSYLPHTLWNLIDPRTYREALRSDEIDLGNCISCKVPRLPHLPLLSSRLHERGLSLNTPFLRRTIQGLKKRYQLDVIVFASFGNALGLPPSGLGVPLVFDYVDWCSSDAVERECLTRAREVICVSQPLYDQARRWNKRTHLLTNGADIERFQAASGDTVRAKLGLSHNKVVSLIGLTASPSHYFIRAVQIAKLKEPTLKCVLVGRSDVVERAVQEADPAGDTFINVGPVPYEQVAEYFAATDVGLYPGDDSDFFKFASPIKVIEYSAAGRPVVSSAVVELERMAWPNVCICQPHAEAFAQGILHALAEPPRLPDEQSLRAFDWGTIANGFEAVLESACRT